MENYEYCEGGPSSKRVQNLERGGEGRGLFIYKTACHEKHNTIFGYIYPHQVSHIHFRFPTLINNY